MKFKVFYWQSYIIQVAKEWNIDVTSDSVVEPKDTVVVTCEEDNVVASTKIHDYMFRPTAFNKDSLYEFLRHTDVKKMSPTAKRMLVKSDSATANYPLEDNDFNMDDEDGSTCDGENSESEFKSEQHVERTTSDELCYEFLDDHTKRKTHAVFKLKNNKTYTLTYAGGPLPHIDIGDYE